MNTPLGGSSDFGRLNWLKTNNKEAPQKTPRRVGEGG
jgi:hypothetical protein